MHADRRVVAAAGIAGGTLLLAWMALMLILAGPRWANYLTGLTGGALLGFYAWQERSLLKRLALSPQMRYGSNAVVFALAVVLAVALANVIASRHSFRADLTSERFFSLSDQTEKILASLDRKVKITAFHMARNQEEAGMVGQLTDLLEQYDHESGQIDVEMVDMDQNPDKAVIYKVNQANTVVFESGVKRRVVLPHELFGYQFMGQQPRREFKGESVITAAILTVSNESQSIVHFLTGHGELQVDDASQNGLSQVKEVIERDNHEVKELNLLTEGKIPADAKVIVIAGPKISLQETELKLLGEYLAGDGRLLVMVDAESTGGLDKMLSAWGVKVLPGVVWDPRNYNAFQGPYVPVPDLRSHRITDDMRKQDLLVMLPLTRALEAGEFEAGTVRTLMETTPESWSETGWKSREAPKFDSSKEKSGPLALGVAVGVNPASPPQMPGAPSQRPEPEPKLVVFGSAVWISNSVQYPPNRDLFANSVNWLAGSEEAISIRPKQTGNRRVFLDNVRASLMTWVTIIITPLALVGIGVFRWWRRRSL